MSDSPDVVVVTGEAGEAAADAAEAQADAAEAVAEAGADAAVEIAQIEADTAVRLAEISAETQANNNEAAITAAVIASETVENWQPRMEALEASVIALTAEVTALRASTSSTPAIIEEPTETPAVEIQEPVEAEAAPEAPPRKKKFRLL